MTPERIHPRPDYLDLVRMILDHQLIDADHVECGKVDDIELEMSNGELRATAIFTGPGVAANHLPRWLRPLARILLGRRSTRLRWSEVEIVESRIKLRSTAEDLGLDEGERKTRRWIEKWPGAE